MYLVRLLLVYFFIVRLSTFSKTCVNHPSTNGKRNEFNCTLNKNDEISCTHSPSKSRQNSVISVCDGRHGWSNKTIYEDEIIEPLKNDLTNQTHFLNVTNLKPNNTYTFTICSSKSTEAIDINNINITDENHEVTSKNCKNCKNYTNCKKYKLEINETANTRTLNIADDQTTKNLSSKEGPQYLYISGELYCWKLYKLKVIEASPSNNASCTIKFNYSGTLNVFVLAYGEKSNLTISLDNERTSLKTEEKYSKCWQEISLQINSTNQTSFSMKGNTLREGYLAISKILFYAPKKDKTSTSTTGSRIKSQTESTPNQTSDPTTDAEINSPTQSTPNQTSDPTTDAEINSPTQSTPNKTSTSTTGSRIKSPPESTPNQTSDPTTDAEINSPTQSTPKPEKPPTTIESTTYSSISTYASTGNTSQPPYESSDNVNLIAHIILAILIILALLFLGYLTYAYTFKKYPFDLVLSTPSIVEDVSANEIKEFSDYYKMNKLRTVRTKATPPAEEPELEVLIDPAKNPPNPNLTSLPIKINDFEKYVMTSFEDDPNCNELTKQYKKIQTNMQMLTTVGSQSKNNNKNRYKNLLPYDDTRVILNDNDNCDYINASYVDGYENSKAFIATQAPLKSTLSDFWCMVWQEKVSLIIMLTELFENGQIKCEQYWPELDQKIRFGNILIELVSKHVFSDYTERNFNVKCNEEVRIIQQLQYTTWPDHGVPLYPQNFTPFIKRLLLVPQKQAPIVVHCNAGCGRTGTLILCDIILRMAAKEKIVDFVKVLRRMREQRINLVNTSNQYVFAHFVVQDCLFGADFSIPINDSFQDEVHKVLRKITVKPMMKELDKVTEQFKKIHTNSGANISDEDKEKNRFSHILPGYAQIYLPMSGSNNSNYINAVLVDCYRCPKKFIVTQQPLPNTVNDFWALIKEYEVNTIVSLNEIEENDKDCPEFWRPQDSTTKLQITEETETNVFYLTKVKILSESDKSTEKTVNIIRMRTWKKDMSYPPKINNLINVWKEMFNTSWKGASQIVVTCHDGATACGLFVALAYLLEKIKNEHICDVFSAIRTVRQSREQFVQDWGQMEFLYKAAKVYIEEFDNYENFN